MKVEVALFATLSKYLPAGTQNRRATLEVKDGATVRDILNQLGVPPELPNILLVNGRQALDTTVLKDGETLSVFPPLAGGAPVALTRHVRGSNGNPQDCNPLIDPL
jgi:molybdopterin converting factor small subunit